MFQASKFAYWCCQLAGWGLLWAAYLLNSYINHQGQNTILIICISGLLTTHLARIFIRRYLPPVASFRKEGVRLLLAIIATTSLTVAFRCFGFYLFLDYNEFRPYNLPAIFTDTLIVIVPWMLIYWFYRLVIRDRARMLERRRLEWRLHEMQAHASESGVSMQGLMDEIGQIVKLIDENPARARSEITAFSRLLREGYLE